MPVNTRPKAKAARPTAPPPKLRSRKSVVASAPPARVGFSHRTLNSIACLSLLLVTLAVYFRATRNPFVNFDDQTYVFENAHIQDGFTSDAIRWAFTSTYATNWHPLTWLSHILDYKLYGLNATGHHFTSIAFHAMNVVLLYLLLAWSTGAKGRSFILAALFALHPLNVESVAWVAERKSVLSMFFLLLALWGYGWYARRPGILRYLAPLFLFACALASKPMAVTLPFLLLLVDFWPLQRVLGASAPSKAFPVPQSPFWKLCLEKVPMLLLSVGSSIITLIAQQSVISSNEHLDFFPRLSNAIYAYVAYLGKTLWPTHLASFYPYEGLRLATWQVSLLFLILAGISVWVWRNRDRRYLPIGWLWFLGSLVPMIGLVQVGAQAMADRYAYLPLLGIFCILVWGIADVCIAKRWDIRRAAIAAGLALTIFSLITWRQIGFWHDSYDLWAHALAVTTDNFMAENYVGTSILLRTYQTTGQRYSEEALVHFQNAVRINPLDPISHLNLGADLHEHGRAQEAIQQYALVLQLTQDPHLIEKALIDLGAASHQLGQYEQARQYYLQALNFDPTSQVVFENLGRLGMDLQIQKLKQSASEKPSASTYFQLGQLQQAVQLNADARNSYQQALKLNPKFADARNALASLDSPPQQ